MKYLIILSIWLFSYSALYAQGENNVWAFGQGYGLDFSKGLDTPALLLTSIYGYEGFASISDKEGHLLFYTNGQTAWDRHNGIMPNSIGLLGNCETSSSQGVAIVPFIGDEQKFYVFTTDALECNYNNSYYLRYSVLDMSLNGGLGDIDTSQKNIIIDSSIGEMMTVIKGNNCFAWLLVHHYDTTLFDAFKITATGIDLEPVVSNSGISNSDTEMRFIQYCRGFMRCSPDGKVIANSSYYRDKLDLELHDFNHETGVVKSCFILTDKLQGGIGFSPNSKILYVGFIDGLIQYDLSKYNDTSELKKSLTYLYSVEKGSHDYFFGFRIGVDKKMYFIHRGTLLSRIVYPNKLGIKCEVQNDIKRFSNLTYAFGEQIIVPDLIDTSIQSFALIDCFQNEMALNPDALGTDYYWSTGETTSSITLSTSSTVWLSTQIDPCRVNIDTFKVALPKIFKNLKDTIICNGEMLKLDAETETGTYKWYDGSTSPYFNTRNAGKFWVTVKTADCDVTDTINVRDANFTIDLGPDQTLCKSEAIVLEAKDAEGVYLWQDGSTAINFGVKETGKYWLQITRGHCLASDTVQINKIACDNCLSIPNAFTPNNDGKNDFFLIIPQCNVVEFSIQIMNRYGQVVFKSNNPSFQWDGNYNNQNLMVGVYYYLIEALFDHPNAKAETFKGDVSLIR